MSKKKAKPETMTLWLTRRGHYYYFWAARPLRDRDGDWDYNRRASMYLRSEVFNRRFPKAWRLRTGGGPLECELTVKT